MIGASRHLLLPVGLVLLALLAPSAAVASPKQVIVDCVQDGVLDREYSNSDLRKARDNLPSDIDEYSDCREVIGAAMKSGSDKGGARGGGDGGGGDRPGGGAGGGDTGGGETGGGETGGGEVGGGADFLNSPEEQAARAQDQAELDALTSPDARDERPQIEVGGETVKPGENGLFDLASASNGLPAPLLLALIALALLAAAGAVVGLRTRGPALARIPVLARIPRLSKIPTPRVRLPRFRR